MERLFFLFFLRTFLSSVNLSYLSCLFFFQFPPKKNKRKEKKGGVFLKACLCGRIYYTTSEGGMPKQGAWCLHIALELKSEFVDKFLLKFAELARHVEANEPDTLSYEIGRSDQHANKFIIVERYAKKEHLADPHQTSEPFKKFKEWMNANEEMFVSKEGFSFYEQQIGYMHR